MTELQANLKNMFENIFLQSTHETLIVEFVDDVSARQIEILQELGVSMQSTYEASHYTGMFLPPNDKTPTYIILIQKDRNQHLYLMTAFHEFQHALLYFHLYQVIFKGNLEKFKNSSINVTFQIYSEFSACREGTSNYIRYVNIDGITKQMMGISLVDQQLNDYNSFLTTSSGYEFLMHASMLLGTLMGARDAIDNFPFEDYYKQIEGLELLENIYSYMESYSAEAKWYEEFDCLVKEFLNV